jgi:cell division protein ZapB
MNESMTESAEQDFGRLASKVNYLIAMCERLKLENESLRDQRGSLAGERASLMEKNELAQSRVEAMITRLKAMESLG